MNIIESIGSNNTETSNIESGKAMPIDAFFRCSCGFRIGTRILTDEGFVAAEYLNESHRLVGVSGKSRSIKGIDRFKFDGGAKPLDLHISPILVRRGALGDNRPLQDLFLRSHHCLNIDGVNIPMYVLVNGVSVTLQYVNAIEYVCIALDERDAIWAEGLRVESHDHDFYDAMTGERENGDRDTVRPKKDSPYPIVTNGPTVFKVRKLAIARLADAGIVQTAENGAHILVDGRRIEPEIAENGVLSFEIPANSKSVELRSRTFVPAYSKPESNDFRLLGLSIKSMQIDERDVALNSQEFDSPEWHGAELTNGKFECRWTRGNIKLPSNIKFVKIEIASEGCYWRATPNPT